MLACTSKVVNVIDMSVAHRGNPWLAMEILLCNQDLDSECSGVNTANALAGSYW